MEIRGPGIHRNHTGCFDSVPSAACARDGTPLSMTSLWFVNQPDRHACFGVAESNGSAAVLPSNSFEA